MATLREDLTIAHLAAAATVVHLLESAIPGFGPWFKPGLANLFSIVALLLYGWRAAALVSMIRVFSASLVLGTFLSPTFIMSFSGALGAVAVLILLSVTGGIQAEQSRAWALGPVGLSLIAALAHITCQIVAARYVVVGHPGLFLLLPVFLAGSWITGLINGFITHAVLQKIEPVVAPERAMP